MAIEVPEITLGVELGCTAAERDRWGERLAAECEVSCRPLAGRPGGLALTGRAEAVEAAFRLLRREGVAAEPVRG
ncbi:MAG: hypothetical protein D6739_00895 [Nitrospirae bacterium]|nr:MAG: hypothetical protein D6739_00895 [Nitrospirota bacterium]